MPHSRKGSSRQQAGPPDQPSASSGPGGAGAFPEQPPSYLEATTGVWGAPPSAPPPSQSQLYQPPQAYPQQSQAYPQQLQAYQQQPQAYPQQPQAYPQQPQPYPQQPQAYPQQPQPYPQQPQAYQQQQPQHSDDDISVWFYAVDEDGNGHITAQELQQALLDESYRPFSTRTCRTLVNMFDDNANGEIELSEFVQLYHYVRKWREIFLRHDADFSGTIELDELLDSLNTVHAPLRFSRQFCDQMLRRFGKRAGGQQCLSLDQFIALNAGLCRLASSYTGQPNDIENFLLKRLRDV